MGIESDEPGAHWGPRRRAGARRAAAGGRVRRDLQRARPGGGAAAAARRVTARRPLPAARSPRRSKPTRPWRSPSCRRANNGNGPRGRTGGVREAVESLPRRALRDSRPGIETYDLLGPPGSGSERFERFRRHAVAVRTGADRVGEMARIPQRDELAVAALAPRRRPASPGRALRRGVRSGPRAHEDPDERLAASGASWASTTPWSAPYWCGAGACRRSIAAAVERHHAPDADGHAAAVGLADLIVHQAAGDPVAGEALRCRRPPGSRRRRGSAKADLRVPTLRRDAPRARPSRGRCRRARSTRFAALPRGRSTSRSRRSFRSRSAPSAPTCTTSTRRSAQWTGHRRC